MAHADEMVVNALRFLSVDQVEAANSGHPGLPLGAAPMAHALWSRHLRFNPANPEWLGRDRFVLSAGHGSALLYSLLHLNGYDLELNELKNFRQLGSLTPGHPEFGLTPGVEATTGPLGQGLGMGVGMAIAQEFLQARYGDLFHSRTFVLASDGDLMEGIGLEAISLAGHLKLGRLVVLYDDNSISLDGPTEMAFSENVCARAEACGWHTLEVADGNNIEAIDQAIHAALAVQDKPSLIAVKTVIGFASPKAGSSEAHGAPLGSAGAAATKTALGWPVDSPFYIPAEAEDYRQRVIDRGAGLEADWNRKFETLDEAVAEEIGAILEGDLPEDWDAGLAELDLTKPMATRDAGRLALDALASRIPWLVGGAADLASSTKTVIKGSANFSAGTRDCRNIWFGVREHAMGAICNGMGLVGLRSFGSTFLVFSDYMRGSIRLSALMQTPVVWVFTHDSVCVGEDGPTHQPVEHVASLRLIPELKVWRPADAAETIEAWRQAVARHEPSCLILSRQALPPLAIDRAEIAEGVARGGYVVRAEEEPDLVFAATGSEVSLALAAADALVTHGLTAMVVSLPCLEVFEEQDLEYQLSVLPMDLPVVTIEAGVTTGWSSVVGDLGLNIGIDRFGESGPGGKVYAHYGFTPEMIVDEVLSMMAEDTEEEYR